MISSQASSYRLLERDQLTIVDMGGGVRTLPENAMGYSFSPDGQALAVTLTDGQRWQMQIVDLQSAVSRTLQEGSHMTQGGNAPPLALRPIAWTPEGILAEQILWASDAPPQGLILVNPADGSTQPMRKEWKDGTGRAKTPTIGYTTRSLSYA